jgi:hypothetical protein
VISVVWVVVWCNIMSLGTFCKFDNFYLTCTGFASGQAGPGFIAICSVQPTEPNVVAISSSDTEEAIELLS